MLRTSAVVAQPRRAVRTASSMFSRPRTECASVEQTIRTPARIASRTCSPLRSSRGASPLTSIATPVLERDREHPLEVQRVLRPPADDPARRMAQAAHVRVAQRLLDARGHLPPRHPLPAVDAGLHPVELAPARRRGGRAARRRGCRTRSRAGRETAPAPRSPRRSPRPGGGRRRRPGRGRRRRPACGRRSRRSRSRARARRGPSPRRSRARLTRSCGNAGRRGRRPARAGSPAARRGRRVRAAPAGTRAGRARRRRPARRARRAAARAPPRTPACPSPARGRSRTARGSAATSSIGTPSTVTPDRAPLGLLHHRDDLRQRGEARQHRRRIRRGADHREVLAGVPPAAHVAGRLAAEGGRHAADQLPGVVEEQAALRPRLALAGERVEQLRLALGPDPRHGPQPPGRRRLAQLAGRPHAERPRDLQ